MGPVSREGGSGLFFGICRKLQGHAVHAVALARRCRAVVEDMAQMAATAAAMHLGPRQKQLEIERGFDRPLDRSKETRPSRTAVEFGLRRVERLSAAGAAIGSPSVLVIERTGVSALGSVLTQDAILLGGESLSPFGVRLH